MKHTLESRPSWVQDLVVYQIYPRSFQDSNGDGVGDLPGICIACSECGQVIFSGTLAPGAEATVEIPQSCPRCSVTGGRGDE